MQKTSEEGKGKASQANSHAEYYGESQTLNKGAEKQKLGTELTAVASANENSSGIPSPYQLPGDKEGTYRSN